jgi:hypothetical protein
MGGTHLDRPVTTVVPYADGYLMVAADGGVFNFSRGQFFGSLSGTPISGSVIDATAMG